METLKAQNAEETFGGSNPTLSVIFGCISVLEVVESDTNCPRNVGSFKEGERKAITQLMVPWAKSKFKRLQGDFHVNKAYKPRTKKFVKKLVMKESPKGV